ncbi:membrane protein [Candidatus Magnetomorum sp. HK-1]|nr:membrane protein [Candidatus Magnetomorum sp. HK-1]
MNENLPNKLINLIPKLKTPIQLAGIAIVAGSYFAIEKISPENLKAQIALFIAIVVIIIFGLMPTLLKLLPKKNRSNLVLWIFVIFCVSMITLAVATGFFLLKKSITKNDSDIIIKNDVAIFDESNKDLDRKNNEDSTYTKKMNRKKTGNQNRNFLFEKFKDEIPMIFGENQFESLSDFHLMHFRYGVTYLDEEKGNLELIQTNDAFSWEGHTHYVGFSPNSLIDLNRNYTIRLRVKGKGSARLCLLDKNEIIFWTNSFSLTKEYQLINFSNKDFSLCNFGDTGNLDLSAIRDIQIRITNNIKTIVSLRFLAIKDENFTTYLYHAGLPITDPVYINNTYNNKNIILPILIIGTYKFELFPNRVKQVDYFYDLNKTRRNLSDHSNNDDKFTKNFNTDADNNIFFEKGSITHKAKQNIDSTIEDIIDSYAKYIEINFYPGDGGDGAGDGVKP